MEGMDPVYIPHATLGNSKSISDYPELDPADVKDASTQNEKEAPAADGDGMYIVESDGPPLDSEPAQAPPPQESLCSNGAPTSEAFTTSDHQKSSSAHEDKLPAAKGSSPGKAKRSKTCSPPVAVAPLSPRTRPASEKPAKKNENGQSKPKDASTASSVKLPCIHTARKKRSHSRRSRRTPSAERKNSHSQRGLVEYNAAARRTQTTSKTVTQEYKKRVLEALCVAKLSAAYEKYEDGDEDAEVVKNAFGLFEALSMHSEFIIPEFLRSYLILFASPIVAMHEARCIFYEDCEEKEELDFPAFLRYGELLQKRVVEHRNFTTRGTEEKIKAIASRVLPSPRRDRTDKMLADIIKFLDDEEKNGEVDPRLRIYERFFIIGMQKEMQYQEREHNSHIYRELEGTNERRCTTGSYSENATQQDMANSSHTKEGISTETHSKGKKTTKSSSENVRKREGTSSSPSGKANQKVDGNRQSTSRRESSKSRQNEKKTSKDLSKTEKSKEGSKVPWNSSLHDSQASDTHLTGSPCSSDIGYQERRRKDNKLIELLEELYSKPKIVVPDGV